MSREKTMIEIINRQQSQIFELRSFIRQLDLLLSQDAAEDAHSRILAKIGEFNSKAERIEKADKAMLRKFTLHRGTET